MEKCVSLLIALLVTSFNLNCSAVLFDDVPKIIVRHGNLYLESAADKNVTIRLKGRNSWFTINDIDVLKVLSGYNRDAKGTTSGGSESGPDVRYDYQLSTLRSALFGESGLYKRLNILENATRVQTSNARLRRMQERLQRTNSKIEYLIKEAEEDNCVSNPCQNGGVCVDLFDSFMCKCPSNWAGTTCGEDVNECAEFAGTVQGCQNGADCINTPGSYSCTCKPGWVGVHCMQRHTDCLRSSTVELCDHGTCITTLSAAGYTCVCEQGWKTNGVTPACSVDINECEEAKPPCASQCINLPGSFTCGPCPAGFTGNGFICRDLNECEVNNGGCSTNPTVACINSYGSYHCAECPLGWTGDGRICVRSESGSCSRNICHPLATCREISNVVVCTCPVGMIGDGVGSNGCVAVHTDPCVNRCRNGGTCIANGTSYTCVCPPGLVQPNCEQPFDPCRAGPCRNGGTCVVQGNGRRYRCLCPPSYRGRICQFVQTRCGGVLTAPSGTLKYPLTTNYEHNVRCAWVIRTNITKVIQVNFTKFDLEISSGCFFDWLQIHDGGGSAAPPLGRFCGSELPKGGRITSTHNMLYLWFRSDNSTARNGFELNWESVEPACGGTIETSTFGTLSSPGSPRNYPPNRDCEWHLEAPFSKRIQLTFFVMALEAHDTCEFDYLAIYDGPSRESSLLQKFCNSSHPSPLLTSSHEATLHFHSDSDNTDAGFQIHYAVVEGMPGCGGMFTASKGSFGSPMENGKYPYNLNCDYLIRLPLDSRIKLHFVEFELENSDSCIYDYVEIYDGETQQSPKVNRYCGSNIPPDYVSESNALLIKFATDFDDSRDGFRIEYDTLCGGIFKDRQGIILSPMYPSPYMHSRVCLYEISASAGQAIKLSFQDFDLEDERSGDGGSFICDFDVLEIFDGVSTNSSQRYCGKKTPNDFISQTNVLTLKFKTDETLHGRGFKANYSFIEIGCGGILKEPHMIIKPPLAEGASDGLYMHNANCEWIIAAPAGFLVYLSWITFQLEYTSDCMYDFVEIFDNGTKVGRYCGVDNPPALTSNSNIMTIRFESDSSDNGEGFTATYYFLDSRKVCGGNYYQVSGTLTSPNYPSNYPDNKNCVWTITVPKGNQIELNVKNFGLEEESRCQYDYLEIRNGLTDTSPLIGKYCGADIPKRVPSFSNHLYVKFASDYSGSGSGFEIEWDGTLTGCGGQITTHRGSITSPNYPAPYDHNAQCDWRITVSKGSTIDIIIPELLLETSSICYYDYLEIFEAVSHHKIGRYCSAFHDILHIKTETNVALVRFVSDVSNANKGFQLSYATNCNNELTDLRGVIESPNFPNFYPDNLQCKWTIKNRKGSKIVVHISHLQLEVSNAEHDEDPCPYDYVTFAEKSGSRFNTIKKICEMSKIRGESIETSSEIMQIIFKSDESGHASGFRLEYRVDGCGFTFNQQLGEFTSPGYPNMYPHNSYCEWVIEAQFGHLIRLNITDLQIETYGNCDYDGIIIANGKSLDHQIALYCGTEIGNMSTVTSNGNNLLVIFYSDASSSGRGFRAVYEQIPARCGGIFRNAEGSVHSPNYPHNYDSNLECQWLIQLDEQNSIGFSFKEFDMELSLDCVHDSVAIYDGPEANAENLLVKHCGNDLPNITTNYTKSNSMLVVMTTDTDTESKGFVLDYNINCGKTIHANGTGNLRMSPSPKNSECIWTIITEPGQHITFTTTHFEKGIGGILRLGEESLCEHGSLQFYDGDSTTSPLKATFCNTYPTTITSQGNALTIRISLSIFSGFEGFYTIYENSCGGTLSSLTGKFASPLYPDSYPVNIECVWTIEASPGNKLELVIEEMDIENSDNCNQDYLEVRDGGPLGELLGTYCGNQPPPMINGQTVLWIKFNSDNDNVGKGFIAQYRYQHSIEISGMNGTITSPRYPDFVPDFEEYKWRLTVPLGYVVQGRFPDGRGEEINTFYNQPLQIFNGYDSTAVPLDQPSDELAFTSSTSTIYITSVMPYFKLVWNAVSKTEIKANSTKDSECKTVISIGQTGQVINSPGYPNGYKENLDCEWIFKPENNILHPYLQIMNIDIDDSFGCVSDYIQVSNSSDMVQWKMLLKACKKEPGEPSTFEGVPYLKVDFHSDFFWNKTGFSGIVAGKCGGVFTANSAVIDISYLAGMSVGAECSWKVHIQPGRKIKFQFKELSLPKSPQGACVSYVMIKNGEDDESPILGDGKYCGTEIPSVPITHSNRAFIKFKNSFPSGNWALAYQTVMNECEYSINLDSTLNSTLISTPNFPGMPAPHSVCLWVILAPLGEHIQIHFEKFDLTKSLNCAEEYVEIKDGATELSPELAIFCNQPNTIDSTGNAMRIKYFTDTIDPKSGFNATVSIGKCGGTYHERSGTITSKNYPHIGQYPSNSVCDYRIALPVGATINITFTDLHLPAGDCKSVDHLEVSFVSPALDNNSTEAQYNMCGSFTLDNLVVNDNELVLRFHSYAPNAIYRGFKLSYTSTMHGCGGNIGAEQGIITTPGYPNGWGNTIACIWRITVPKGRRVKIEVLDYDVPMPHDNYTSPFRSLRRAATRIGFFNDHRYLSSIAYYYNGPPPVVYSSDNRMLITAWLTAGTGFRGIKLKFSSNEATTCEGSLEGAVGSITFPPRSAQSSSYCLYEFPRLQSKETVSIKIMNFHIANTFLRLPCDFRPPLAILDGTRTRQKVCENTTEKTIRSPFPDTKIQILQVTQQSIPSFNLTFKRHQCGGIVPLSDPYAIVNPLILATPQDHYGPLDCAWFVSRLTKDIVHFQISGSVHMKLACDKEYLNILRAPEGPHLLRICGDMTVANLSSLSQAFIEYHSDDYDPSSALNISIDDVDECGDHVFGAPHTIRLRKDYKSNVECIWTIKAATGYHLVAVFKDRFFIEDSANCSKDVLEVYDFARDSWSLIARVCGRNRPPSYNSTENMLRLKFRSDAEIEGDGFTIRFEVKCGGTYEVSSDVRSMTSPNYPEHYHRNLECNYTFVAPNPTDTILVQFVDFKLESIGNCHYDNVTIYTYEYGAYQPLGSAFCTDQELSEVRSKNRLQILFKTDGNGESRGFKFHYSIDKCGGNIVRNTLLIPPTQSGKLRYPSNIHCVWNITGPPQQQVVIKFHSFEIEISSHCYFDYVRIYKGDKEEHANSVATLCGNLTNKLPIIVIDSNQALIHFHADASNDGRGFVAEILFKERCDETINLTVNSPVYVFDKFYGTSYQDNLNCNFFFNAPDGYHVRVEFQQFHVAPCAGNETNRCSCDYFELRDGGGPFSELFDRYCGHDIPPKIISTRPKLFATFVSDSMSTSNGINATFTAVASDCGQTNYELEDVKGTTIETKGNTYLPNLRCFWKISSSMYSIHIHFTKFDLQGPNSNGECINDVLQIYTAESAGKYDNGLDNNVIVNGVENGVTNTYAESLSIHPEGRLQYCGNHTPQDYYSNSHTVYVMFKSDSEIQASGVKFIVTPISGCFKNYTGTQGRIVLNTYTDCEFYVLAPENYTISLYFRAYYALDDNCANQYFAIFDADTGTELSKKCGQLEPSSSFFSNTNHLKIKTKNSGLFSNYDATYLASNVGQGCGGQLNNFGGIFTSPFYPLNVRNDSDCRWEVQVPSNMQVALVFNVFDMGAKITCRSDYLQIIEYETNGEEVVRQFCGEDKPAPYRGRRNRVAVRYRKTVHFDGTGWVISFGAIHEDTKLISPNTV